MKILFQVHLDKIDETLDDILKIDGVEGAYYVKKQPVIPNILDRNPNYQIELFDVVLNIILTIASEDLYKYTKERLNQYFDKRNVKITKIEDDNKEENKQTQ